MAPLTRFHKTHISYLSLVLILVSIQSKSVLCRVYKVGDLNAWGIPSSSNPQLYSIWSKYHSNLNIGDSLFFLYPPSQDSVIQVTKESYDSCNLKDPILYMNNGNSLFNITRPGDYFFTSGVEGHCNKSQKLHISVYGNGSNHEDAFSPAPSASAPSYPTVFGSIPAQDQHASAASPFIPVVFLSAAIGVFVSMLV